MWEFDLFNPGISLSINFQIFWAFKGLTPIRATKAATGMLVPQKFVAGLGRGGNVMPVVFPVTICFFFFEKQT